jgi:hypothetical protein
VELRHESWNSPRILQTLEDLNVGLCDIDQPLFAIVFERPGKLNLDGAQLSSLSQWIQSFAIDCLFFVGCLTARVGKDFVKLGGEDEVRIMFDSLEPGPRGRRRGRIIKAAVDFRGVEIFRDQRQGIELCA